MCDLSNYLRAALGAKEGNCSPNVVNTGAWGFPAQVCQKHYDLASWFLEADPPTFRGILNNDGTIKVGQAHVAAHAFPPALLADYVKLLALMQNRAAVLATLAELNTEFNAAIARKRAHPHDLADRFATVKRKGRNYIRLSRALSYYEQYCWFPSNHVVFSGALTAANFYWSLANGFMPKDPGAGVLHGDFSHRLQWHAVMRAVTNGFATPFHGAWQHSPLQLFTSLGAGPAVNRGIWGAVFDAQGRPNYSDPANLYADAMQANPNLNCIQPLLVKSKDKRRMIETECQRVLNLVIQSRIPPLVRTYITTRPILHKPDRPIAANVANVVYFWKKKQAVSFDPIFNPLNAPAIPPLVGGVYQLLSPNNVATQALYNLWDVYFAKLTEYAAKEFWIQNINDHRSDIQKWMKGSRGTDYVEEQSGIANVDGVLVSNDGDRMIAINIPNRIILSQGSFNSATVSFTQGIGCHA